MVRYFGPYSRINLDDKIEEIHCELKQGNYKTSPVRRTYIEKDD
jgi:hypothetical protein